MVKKNQRTKRTEAPMAQNNKRIVRNKPPRRGINPCVEKYFIARTMPFSPAAKGACVASSSVNSFKYANYTRTSITANPSSTGELIVCLRPNAANNDTQLSYGQSAGGVSSVGDALGNIIYGTGSPFTQSQLFGAGLECRFVAGGLRITCETALLSAQGTMYCATTARPTGFVGSTTSVQLQNRPSTKYKSACDKVALEAVCRISEIADEAHFHSDPKAYATVNPMVAAVLPHLNAAGGGQTYLVETISHWEVRGSDAATMSTTDFTNPAEHQSAFTALSTTLGSMDSKLTSFQMVYNKAANLLGRSYHTGKVLYDTGKTAANLMGRAAPLMLAM
jgi:hypothetical protein